jgi:hypothetical protein
MQKIDWLICLGSISSGIVAAFIWWWNRSSLWEDEVIALTHANQPFPLFFIEVLRNDVHPPLYFLQLKAWAALGFESDAMILLNSMLWAFVSLVILFNVAKKLCGKKAGWYSIAIYAAFPIFAYGAGNLRMYSMVPGLALLTWYANQRWFKQPQNKWLAVAIALEIFLAYVHAIEFYFVAFLAFAALAEAVMSTKPANSVEPSRPIVKWLLWQLLAGLCMSPLVGSGVVRGSDASAPGSLWGILSEPGALIAGWGPSEIFALRAAGLVIFAFFAVVAVKSPIARLKTLIIPLGALAVAILVSIIFKPMLKTPVFASNLLPFLALGAGIGIATLSGRWVRVGTAIALLLLSAAAIPLVFLQLPKDSFAGTAAYVRANAKAGDVVVIPNVSVYWGILRYAVGPHWGRPLDVMPIKQNAQWFSLLQKLGPTRTAALGLQPKTNIVVENGVSYAIGPDATQTTKNAGRIWVVQRDNYAVDAELAGPFVRKTMVRVNSGDVVVSLFEKTASGNNIAQHPSNLTKNDPVIIQNLSIAK